MKKIIWRFDDLNFAEVMEGEDASLWKLQGVADAFLRNGQKANFALITRYQNKTFKDNPQYYQYLRKLDSLGCKIVCHGVYHENFRKIKTRRETLKMMKRDFRAMGFVPDTIVFPYVSFPYSLIPFLKEEGFKTVFRAKGRNLFVQKINRIFDVLADAVFDITVLYDNISTAVSYYPPRLRKFEKIEQFLYSSRKDTIFIMDHYWFYTPKTISVLKKFIARTIPDYQYISLDSLL